jgi:APA family basic amino acid/polyamine antiporter
MGGDQPRSLVRGLGLLDATMIIAGSMIGSGIFIVSADMTRLLGSSGWLLAAWAATGVLTLAGGLSYGELAAMFPRAGGQYVFLREAYSPMWGFLFGWSFFLVIQTGTIAAVAVAFARFLGVFFSGIAQETYLLDPIALSDGYALSLSTQQLVAIASIILLTWINTRGLSLGKLIQNTFTVAKTLSLAALIAIGLLVGYDPAVVSANFAAPWSPTNVVPISSDLGLPTTSAADGAIGLLIAFCVAQVGSLFSADAWHSATFVAGEVREPRRTIPLALALGPALVIALYLLANLAYLVVLPLDGIAGAPADRVGTSVLNAVFGRPGEFLMAAAIVVSTFGCNNGLILSGARVYYAMARDGLFFRPAGRLNARNVPGTALVLQAIWASLLVLPRTREVDAATGAVTHGNLYLSLLDYVVFAVLIFYALTVAGIIVLRRRRPDVERPYRAFGYPAVQILYIAGAAVILAVLFFYKTRMTWPGLVIVLTGIPVYFLWRRARGGNLPPDWNGADST